MITTRIQIFVNAPSIYKQAGKVRKASLKVIIHAAITQLIMI